MSTRSPDSSWARRRRAELLQLPNLENLRPAGRAGPLNRGAAVLHGHLLRILDLDLLLFLDAIALWHRIHLLELASVIRHLRRTPCRKVYPARPPESLN